MNTLTINDTNLKIRRSQGIIASFVDDEYVMMNIESGQYYSLGESAGRIWELIEKNLTIRELCEKIEQEYEVEFEQCLNDTLPFLNDLREKGLIDVSSE